jgi:hypothetical protein
LSFDASPFASTHPENPEPIIKNLKGITVS